MFTAVKPRKRIRSPKRLETEKNAWKIVLTLSDAELFKLPGRKVLTAKIVEHYQKNRNGSDYVDFGEFGMVEFKALVMTAKTGKAMFRLDRWGRANGYKICD